MVGSQLTVHKVTEITVLLLENPKRRSILLVTGSSLKEESMADDDDDSTETWSLGAPLHLPPLPQPTSLSPGPFPPTPRATVPPTFLLSHIHVIFSHLRNLISSNFSPDSFFNQSAPKRALSLTLIAVALLSLFGLSLHAAFERALLLTEPPDGATLWPADTSTPAPRFLIVPTERLPGDYVAIPAEFFQRHGSIASDLLMSSFCSIVIACAAALFYTAITLSY